MAVARRAYNARQVATRARTMSRDSRAAWRAHSGVTLVELVAVIAIAGLLAVFAASRFFQARPFAERGFADESRAVIAYAHKLAIASGCDIRVVFSGAGYSVERWPACVPADHSAATSPVSAPGGGALAAAAPDSVAVSAIDVFFDKLGRPRRPDAAAALLTNRAALRISVGQLDLQIEPETGFVRLL